MPGLSLLIKPASGMCNMRCRYCFYTDVSAHRETVCYGTMSEETLQTLMRRAFSYADGHISFAFQGGEPLLAGKDFFRRVISLQRKYNQARHLSITNAVQTNGTLMDDEWGEIFKEGGFLVGVSVDGTEALHDLYRVDAAGQPTHKRVMEGIQVLQRHQIDYNVLCVVTKQAAQKAEEVFDALALHRYLQFIPCLDELNGQKHEFSLDASGYGSFLIHTFDRYEKAWRKNRPISIRTFDNWIGMLLGNPPESCGMSGCCGQYYLVEADGSVYPCDFYVLDEWRMGNIKETSFFRLASSEIGERFRKMSWRLPESCRSCPYVALCRGGCRREREPFVDNEPSLSCLCEGNKRFFDARMSQLKQLARNIQSLQSYRKEH